MSTGDPPTVAWEKGFEIGKEIGKDMEDNFDVPPVTEFSKGYDLGTIIGKNMEFPESIDHGFWERNKDMSQPDQMVVGNIQFETNYELAHKQKAAGEKFKEAESKFKEAVYEIVNDKSDSINHPAHYCQGKIECIDVTEQMSFLEGNAIKYIWRHKYKNGKDDILKAIWYCKRILKTVYGVDN